MRRLWTMLLLGMAGALSAAAFEWPLKNPILTATFGEHRGDHFHGGVDLGGGEQSVFPISGGELVFMYEEDASMASLPAGLGNFLVLQHQGGIRSVYAHLKSGSMGEVGKSVQPGTPIGVVGESGYSAGKHLHLSVIDTEMGTVINPHLILPPLGDNQEPVIRDVFIRSGKELIRLEEGVTVRRGEVEVLGNVYDIRPDVTFLWKMAPYKIYLYQDGRERTSLVFGSLHERARGPDTEGTRAPGTVSELTLVGGEQGFRSVFESEWLYRLGFLTLVPGESSVVVFAADFSGNESSREFLVRVAE